MCCVAAPVNAAGITNFSKLVTADYWIENNTDGDMLILDAQGVEEFNKTIRKVSPTVVDLEKYPETVSKRTVKAKLNNFEALEEDLYLRGNKVSDNYKGILRKLVNSAAITDDVQVKYAVVVRRSNLRNLPTGEGLFYFAADKDFDALQETALDPCDPVVVLHTSENGQFHYIQAANYSGWISTYDIAFTDRSTWLQYVNPKKFVVVVGKSVKLKTWEETVEYQQGSRIPIHNVDDFGYVLNVAGHLHVAQPDHLRGCVRQNRQTAKAAGEISDPLSAKAEGKHHFQEFVSAERHAALF
ncbi:MAG: SH3 domain-containing protein [Phascolarctobacterium sp.]|nr:SH3 domain-containing protein [Phascolarctobacterium sp.]